MKMKKVISGLLLALVFSRSGYSAEEGAMDDEAFAVWLNQAEEREAQERIAEEADEINFHKGILESLADQDLKNRQAEEQAAEEAEQNEIQRALAESLLEGEVKDAKKEETRLKRVT